MMLVTETTRQRQSICCIIIKHIIVKTTFIQLLSPRFLTPVVNRHSDGIARHHVNLIQTTAAEGFHLSAES